MANKPGPKPGQAVRKGIPNRDTVSLKEKIAAICGPDYDPVVGMAAVDRFGVMPLYDPQTGERIGQTPVDPALRQKCAATVAEYIHPKRKAIEISGPEGDPIEVTLHNDCRAVETLSNMLSALDVE